MSEPSSSSRDKWQCMLAMRRCRLNQVIDEARKQKLDRIVIGKISLWGAYGCCDKS